MPLDLRTVFIVAFGNAAICAAMMFLLWRQHRQRYAGLGLWMAAYAIALAALVLLGLRGLLPDWLSIIGGNTLTIGSTMLLYAGLRRFVGLPAAPGPAVALVAVFVAAHAWFTLGHPDLLARSVNVALAMLVFFGLGARLLRTRADAGTHPGARLAGSAFGVMALVNVLRVPLDLATTRGHDILAAGSNMALAGLLYSLTYVFLTMTLLLLVTRRLSAERLAQEAQLRAREEQLRQEQKLATVGTMASGIAHEINNPLMAIINLAHLAADQAPEQAGPVPGLARTIITEGNRIAGIVRGLLAFARREEHVREPATPAELVASALELARHLLVKGDIALDVDVAADLPPVNCAPQGVQQVLVNLLVNARDALNERWPAPHPAKRASLACRPLVDGDGRWVRFTVGDGGHGIPSEIIGRIFDPFFTTKPRGAGTGLGLSISYGIAREHGGRLSVDSAPGEGSRFHLDLPAA